MGEGAGELLGEDGMRDVVMATRSILLLSAAREWRTCIFSPKTLTPNAGNRKYSVCLTKRLGGDVLKYAAGGENSTHLPFNTIVRWLLTQEMGRREFEIDELKYKLSTVILSGNSFLIDRLGSVSVYICRDSKKIKKLEEITLGVEVAQSDAINLFTSLQPLSVANGRVAAFQRII
ncbi:hypothetical protein J6590_098330 [Homalodisca vitripennis]|nr:hypothetical protein J6590_098330 [Homalodisca vitripennis]